MGNYTFTTAGMLSYNSNVILNLNVVMKCLVMNSNLNLEGGSSFDLLISVKMTVRALYFCVLGFSGLFAIQVISGVI